MQRKRSGSRRGTKQSEKLPTRGLVIYKGTQSAIDSLGLFADGPHPLADFIHPGARDPAEADRIRIRAAARLCGQESDVSRFYDLVGGKEQFERLCPDVKWKGDIARFVDDMKRALEKLAREQEDLSQQEIGAARACREATLGIDMTAESDPEILQKNLESAILHRANLYAESWSRWRSPAKWRQIITRLKGELSHPTLQRQWKPKADVNPKNSKEWRFKISDLPAGYVDNADGFVDADHPRK